MRVVAPPLIGGPSGIAGWPVGGRVADKAERDPG